MSESSPSPAGDNGRDRRGRFGPGNKAGKGNPQAKKAQAIRAALFRAVSAADVGEAVRKLVEQAKGGDRLALAELLDRTIGKAVQADLLQRIEELERIVEERLAGGGYAQSE